MRLIPELTRSLDISHTENVWKIIKSRIQKQRHPPVNMTELWTRVDTKFIQFSRPEE